MIGTEQLGGSSDKVAYPGKLGVLIGVKGRANEKVDTYIALRQKKVPRMDLLSCEDQSGEYFLVEVVIARRVSTGRIVTFHAPYSPVIFTTLPLRDFNLIFIFRSKKYF